MPQVKFIPQIKSVVGSLAVILIGSPLLTLFIAYQVGSFQHWNQALGILKGATLPAVMGTVGWILLRSPFAGKFTELLNIKTDNQGHPVVTKLTVQEPAPSAPASPAEKEKSES